MHVTWRNDSRLSVTGRCLDVDIRTLGVQHVIH